MGFPRNEESEKKIAWLRSQIIGADEEFDSPLGRRRITYADHTASGRSLHYVENYIINNVLPFYGNTHTSDSFVGRQTTKMVREAAQYIKKCLGGGEDDAIMFCGSGSTAAIKRLQEVMGIAIPSVLRERVINCLSNEERWVVFVGPYEHHSNLLSWRQSLAQVIEIGLDENGLTDIEDLRQKLEFYKHANRPILGSFSACSNVTGIYTNTRKIARLLHEYGGFSCFDFAASGPYVKIDMRSGKMDSYDAVFLSLHKFIGGPGSPGILLMSKALYRLTSSAPSTCGGGTVDYVNGFSEMETLYLDDIEERENGGTPQIIQTTRAALAFWVKEYIGYQVIENREKNYIKRALERLLPNKNIWILGNTSAERQAILSFLIYSTTNSSLTSMTSDNETGTDKHKPLHGTFISTLLNDLFGIQARGGCDCAGPYGHSLLKIDETRSHAFRSAIQKGYMGVKPGWTRVSFPYYMSNEEFEFILAALEFLAIHGQSFLPLYDFDLRSGNWTFNEKALKNLLEKENYHKVPLSTIINDMQVMGINHNEFKGCFDGNAKHNPRISTKYARYIETAKLLASILPKFSPQSELQDGLDLDFHHFKV